MIEFAFDQADEQRARERDIRRSAMDALARREHSRVQLARKLHGKFSEYDLVEQSLEKLVQDGLLSDERFTEAYVNYRQRAGFGPVKIRGELRERGVDESLSQRFIDVDAACWLELAELARCKRFGSGAPGTSRERQRQEQFLKYRGFSHEHIRHSFDTSE